MDAKATLWNNEKIMKKVGTLGHHMMKRTCTNQVNIDYSSEEDMVEKFRIMLNLEAIATAMFSNSPFDQGKISKYKSLRSHFGIILMLTEQDYYHLFLKKILILKIMQIML